VAEDVAGRGLDPAPLAGHRLAGSEESTELASSVALRLPVMRWEALLTLPDGVLRLPADTVGIFFFFCDVTSLLWRVDRALTKASSSCLSMTLRRGRISVESVLFKAVAAATVALVTAATVSDQLVLTPLISRWDKISASKELQVSGVCIAICLTYRSFFCWA